jgi:uncharacterized membrane protein YidH (DUF202 family)
MKKFILLLIAILMIVLGLTGVFWPTGLIDLAKWSFSSKGLYIAAALRIVLGALIFSAAGATTTPKIVRVIGAIIVIGGIATAFLSVETAQRIASWWLENGEDRLRMTACVPLAIGIFLGGVTLFRKP